MRKHLQIFISLGILLLILLGTGLVVIYGKGYQIAFNHGRPEIAGTGLLVATSTPNGAQVFINDHLTTATNNTINLAPGTYKVRIFKDGFFAWEKTLEVQKEVVSKADAWLISKTPKLENVTELGVTHSVVDPSRTKIAFTVASQSAKRNGIYIFNMNSSPILTLQSSSTQIADDTVTTLSTATLSWSPDGQNILATVPTTDTQVQTTYLLSATGFNAAPKDVTETLQSVIQQWNQEKLDKQQAQITALKPTLRKLVEENFTILAWSPDETKILYVASNSATLPAIITPPLIGRDSMPEERNIQKGTIYVYDIAEDKNYPIAQDGNPEKMPNIMWIPDSKHLLFQHEKKVDILEYDGGNKTTVYAGPFLDNFVTPWPDGNSFVILTNLGNTETTANLYTVTLK
jgi:hypothetical protein